MDFLRQSRNLKGRASSFRPRLSVEPLEHRRLPASVLSFGAVGDGLHNDQPAFLAALNDLSSQGGGTLTVPAGTYKIVQSAAFPALQVPDNVSIVGAGAGSTELDLYSDVSTPDYRALFMVTGSNTTLSGMSMVRKSVIYGVMVPIAPVSNFTMQGVTIDGQASVLGNGFHGTELLPTSDPASGISFRDSTITGVDYGFFTPNSLAGSVSGFSVTNCDFHDNYADDLEFNAPNGTATNVTVSGNRFADNHGSALWAGFGVGFANVTGGTISNNTFTNYNYEPIHLEDRTSQVSVSGNTFVRGYTQQTDWSTQVNVITGSHDISIINNLFDLTQNSNQVSGIYIGPGGVDAVYPYNVTFSGNTMKLNALGTVATNYSLSGYVESNNLIEAPPRDLTATANASGGVQLNWAAGSPDDLGYDVFRKAAGAASWSQVAALPGGMTTFDDTGLTAVVSYSYRVVATYGASTSVPAQAVPIALAFAAPSVTWASPAGITYGTPLSGAQLNPTASAPGTFTYSPPLGTVLGAGQGQTLTATFTPDDGAHYTTTTVTVTIDVARATPTVTWAIASDITYGTALGGAQLNALSGLVPGSFVYTPGLGTVLRAGQAQALSAVFVPTDTANYDTIRVTVDLNVLPAAPAVTAPSPIPLVVEPPDPSLSVSNSGSITGGAPSSPPTPSTPVTTVSLRELNPSGVSGGRNHSRRAHGSNAGSAVHPRATKGTVPVRTRTGTSSHHRDTHPGKPGGIRTTVAATRRIKARGGL